MGADRAIELRALMASIHASPGATRFGEDAALYDFARPEYPADLFVWLRAKCKLDARSDCFEIGAGTGHATLPLLATPVRSLLAIEPDARLAERLREKTSDDARLAIEIARFEDARLRAAMFDFGFAAMSLHWLARMKALTRVRAALNASGLALPARKITINLAPADLPKEGSHYDLPIALAVMATTLSLVVIFVPVSFDARSLACSPKASACAGP
jgi:hypothetical protein